MKRQTIWFAVCSSVCVGLKRKAFPCLNGYRKAEIAGNTHSSMEGVGGVHLDTKRWLSKSEVICVRSSLNGKLEEEGGTGGSIAKGRKIILRHGQMSLYSIDLNSLHSHPSFKSGKTKVSRLKKSH